MGGMGAEAAARTGLLAATAFFFASAIREEKVCSRESKFILFSPADRISVSRTWFVLICTSE